MNWLSLRNNRLKVKTGGRKNTDRFRGICRTYPNLIKENWRMSSACNQPVGLANTRISTDYECPKISLFTGCARRACTIPSLIPSYGSWLRVWSPRFALATLLCSAVVFLFLDVTFVSSNPESIQLPIVEISGCPCFISCRHDQRLDVTGWKTLAFFFFFRTNWDNQGTIDLS